MVYRTFGKTGLRVSALGFGCMRLPMIGEGIEARVDVEQTTPLLRAAFDAGINYFDTAWFYCNNDSQRAVGLALDGIRDRVILSTKLPTDLIREREDFWKFLMASLERLNTDYIDFYHFHAMGVGQYMGLDRIREMGILSAVERALAKRYIRHLSFSFHDKPEVIRTLVDTGLFSSLLCQYNVLDRKNEEQMAYAASKGVAVAVMGPLGGGTLAKGGDGFVKRLDSGASTAAEAALRFVWGNPSVSVVLSGMNSIEQLRENLKCAESANDVTAGEWSALANTADRLRELDDIRCTKCKYCEVCPQGIKPEAVFDMYLNHRVWGMNETAKSRYSSLGEGAWLGSHPNTCTDCGTCSERCPQKINIPAELKRVSKSLQAL